MKEDFLLVGGGVWGGGHTSVYYLHVVIVCQGYRAEMDNPALSGLLPLILRSKRDILFGNMPEIYNFHSRQAVKGSHMK